MKQQKCFENYPAWMVAVSNLVSLSIYFIGGFFLSRIGFLWVAVYVLFILFSEYRLLKGHCVNCYYFGKTCSFGKGRVSSLLFKKGSPGKFDHKKMTWKDMFPDLFMSVTPIAVGIFLVITKFSWLTLFLVALLFVLSFSGNAFVRGQLACKYCKQRELGCPAQKLFEKAK